MSWVKIDDQFPQHPKLLEVGPLGLSLFVAGLCYCARYLTDGFIPRPAVSTLLDFDGINVKVTEGEFFSMHDDVTGSMVAGALVEAGLWEEAPKGYQVHDYLEFNPSKVQVLSTREARSVAGSVGGQRSGESRREAKTKQVASDLLEANAKQTRSKSEPRTRTPSPTPVVGTKETESTTPKSIPKQTSARRSVQSAEAIDNFNVFAEALWENYPRDKDGVRPGRKAKFLAALKKVDVSEWDDLEAGLEKYKLWAKVKKGYVLNAETWVMERMWVESLEAQPIKQINGGSNKPSMADPEVASKYTEGFYAPMFNRGAKT